ncbi:hypothetical protein BGX24_001079 [Mortierella sp. AD032]|nr:hypothetical protein BGX24_001079 [Mortierella sp. AD032]
MATQRELIAEALGVNNLAIPNWLPPMITFQNQDHFPFAPMVSLHRLSCSMKWRDHELNQHEHREDFDAEAHSIHVCWMIMFTPSLTHLTLEDLSAPSPLFFRLLIRGLSRLTSLRRLEIISDDLEFSVLSTVRTLFDYLPLSIHSLGLVFNIEDDLLDESLDLHVTATDQDWEEGSLIKRDGPLANLVRLKLPVLSTGYRAVAINCILEQCPNLQTFSIPTLSSQYTGQAVGSTIQEHCPGIRRVLIRDAQLYQGTCVLDILEAIPYPQLEFLIKDADYIEQQPSRMDVIIQKHIPTWCLVQFAGFCKISGTTIQALLTGCPALEVLDLRSKVPGDAYVMLDDIAVADWVCLNLRFLRVAVGLNIEDQVSEDPEEVQRREGHFRDLARQIGNLHRLRVLNLAAVTVNPVGDAILGEFEFSGILTLENAASGRHGHLSFLSELRGLEDVRGNLMRRALDRPRALGRAEVEFIAEHWPKMKKNQGQRPLIKLKLAANYLQYVVEG